MVKITNEFDNVLLKRKEVTFDCENSGSTVSRQEAKQQLAKKLKADEELIIIENITSHFGKKMATVKAYVYEDKTALEQITLKHIIKRNTAPAQEEAEAEA